LIDGPFSKISPSSAIFTSGGNYAFPEKPIFFKASFGGKVTNCEAVSVNPNDCTKGISRCLLISKTALLAGPPPSKTVRTLG
ncbi:hypothetical protein OK14_03130, partial [Listeria monocytogenes]